MRLSLLSLLFALLAKFAGANHIVGGEIHYEYLGDSTYKITVKVYRDCFAIDAAPFDDPIHLGIFYGDNSWFENLTIPFPGSVVLPNDANNPCLVVPPTVCVEQAIYETTVMLPPVAGGYTIVYQRCCRNSSLVNISLPDETGATYTAHIPGPEAYNNSDPYYNIFPPTIVCAQYPLVFDHSSTDLDGDSLVYGFCTPYSGATQTAAEPTTPSPPPYTSVSFVSPYSYTDPMGGAPPLAIDPATGLLTGTPMNMGQFVVGICVKEYRDGVLLSEHRREFQFNVAECSPVADAVIVPNPPPGTPLLVTNCTNFQVTFPNHSTPNATYHWDFGVPNVVNDTSNLTYPTFVYPDTGTYLVTLIVNPGTICSDTANAFVVFYPTLTAAMDAPAGCSGNDLQFNDESVATYGEVNAWSWTFGDNGTSNDQNPVHAYDAPGLYNVQLIVESSVGCMDTIDGTVNVLTGVLESVSNDTTICKNDVVVLGANTSANATFTWTPNYNINSTQIDSPTVTPDSTTMYVVEVVSLDGCVERDSVLVTVVDTVVAVAGDDTVLCPGQSVNLHGSGGLTFAWSPSTWLSDTTLATVTTTPDSSIVYVFTTSVGSCFASAAVSIGVLPYPTLTLVDSLGICPGGSVQLIPDGGTTYLWSPSSGLSSTTDAAPWASPDHTTMYHVVAQNANACPISLYDSVLVTVADDSHTVTPTNATVILGESIDLQATNGASYVWSPDNTLQNPTAATTMATPLENTTYHVFITYPDGCTANDSVVIDIQIDPLLIFPNAFTPNGDGYNSRFRPFKLGLVDVEVFRVFNRWGQTVYDSKSLDGWDGKYNGVDQEVGSYAYYFLAKGSVSGKAIEKEGNVTLLR